MKRLMRIVAPCLVTVALMWSFFSSARPQTSIRNGGPTDLTRSQSQGVRGPDQGVYAPDPDQIWNRMFRVFYVRHAQNGRQYGGDELDPYLWWQTKYLLSGSSHDVFS